MTTKKATSTTTAKRTRSGGARAVKDAPGRDEATAPRKAGVVLRTYRSSLSMIEKTSTGVGGQAIGALGTLGLPDATTDKLKNGQAKAVRGVTDWSDDVGTKMATGISKGREYAVIGAKQGARAWVRGMKFLITLR